MICKSAMILHSSSPAMYTGMRVQAAFTNSTERIMLHSSLYGCESAFAFNIERKCQQEQQRLQKYAEQRRFVYET